MFINSTEIYFQSQFKYISTKKRRQILVRKYHLIFFFAYYYSKNETSEITIIDLICYRINHPQVSGRQPALDETFVKLMHHPEVLQKERITFAISPRVQVYNKTQLKTSTNIRHCKGKIKCFNRYFTLYQLSSDLFFPISTITRFL